jgi:hypothetical protein
METEGDKRDSAGRGDRRATDRRRGDRRRDDRRLPPPIWRRPAAYVAYGVIGTFALVLVFNATGDDELDSRQQAAIIERTAMAEPAPGTLASPAAPTRDAYTIANYEGLIAEGEQAVGQIVRTELYCGSLNQVAVRETDRTHPTLLGLADSEGRVAGAECRWSREARSSDFLLIVPSNLAEEFARAPEVELNFVRRRQIPAHVEWLGRSEALSLRYAGVLRDITR